MAITEAPKLISEEAEWSDGKPSVHRVYIVKGDSALECQNSAFAVAAPLGLARLSASTRYTDAKVSSTRFNVDIGYGIPEAKDIQKQEQQGNPMDWAPKISYPTETTDEPYFKDTAGTLVLNSSKQPFDNLKPRRRTRTVISVQMNVANSTFNPLSLAVYADTTNAAATTVDGVLYPIGTLLMTAPQASEKLKYNDTQMVEGVPVGTTIEYRAITFQLLINPEGWKDKLADTGYDELILGKWVPILDELGQKVTKAYPLDGAGRKAATNPATLTFVPYSAGTWGTADLA